MLRTITDKKYTVLMTVLSSSQFLLFLIYGLSRHFNYLSSINDLGHFDQAIWGFIEGIPFLNTDIFSHQICRLGIHFDPILIIFVPFYWIFPTVVWLIIAQSLALSMSSWPIFLLAKKKKYSEKNAFIWAVIFSLNPFILNAAAWDFHPVVLAVPFIAMSYLAVECKKPYQLITACIIILSCKEHFGLLVAGFGFLWGIRHKEWRFPLSLIFIGIGSLEIVLNIIIPHFSPINEHIMFSKGQGQLSRYSWIGGSFPEIVSNIITRPIQIINVIMGQFKAGNYFLLLFLPFLGSSLMGIEYLLPGMADFGVNVLSANSLPRSIFSYHSATLIPIITVAAIYGVKRINLLTTKFPPQEISIFFLVNTLIFSWLVFPFFNLPGSFNIWKQKVFFRSNDSSFSEIKKTIKPEFSISIQANIGPHFTNRQNIYTYPNKINQVDAILLRLESPTYRVKGTPGEVGSLAHHLQIQTETFLESVKNILNNNQYGITIWDDPWLLLIKGEKNSANINPRTIDQKIKNLEKIWVQNALEEGLI